MLQWALIVAIKHGQARPIDGHGFPRSKATRTSFSCSRSTCSITTAYGKWPATTTTAVAKPTTTINTFSNGTSIHSLVFNSTTTSAAKSTATGNASSNWTSFSPFSGTAPAANEFLLRDNISSKIYSQRECVWQLDKLFPLLNFQIRDNTSCQGTATSNAFSKRTICQTYLHQVNIFCLL